jgi:hypothetical protein
VLGEKMIAFRININGESIVTAGQDDWSVLSTHVDALRDKENLEKFDLSFSVGGLSLENEENFCQHFRWASQNLKVGDIVSVEIIESDTVENPKKRYRSDHEIQENPFTEEEARELRYQDYLELKKEFESNVT